MEYTFSYINFIFEKNNILKRHYETVFSYLELNNEELSSLLYNLIDILDNEIEGIIQNREFIDLLQHVKTRKKD